MNLEEKKEQKEIKKIEIRERDLKKSPESIRNEGYIPGVLYGRTEKSTPVSIKADVFEKKWKEVGESTIIILTGLAEDKDVLIYDVDVHPLTGTPIHVDFYAIERGKKLTATVPLEFVGEAPAVKDLGGNLLKAIHEIEVESLPKDLPSSIEVDVSSLDNFEKQIQIKDLKLPEGVEPQLELEDVVVFVDEVEEEPEEIEAPEGPDLSQIEVEKRGKEEEPSEEGGAENE